MFLYSKIPCRVIGKVLYNSTFKGRENGPMTVNYLFTLFRSPVPKNRSMYLFLAPIKMAQLLDSSVMEIVVKKLKFSGGKVIL